MHLAHEFLQHFCRGNANNQLQIHRHIDLFFQTGDSVREGGVWGGGGGGGGGWGGRERGVWGRGVEREVFGDGGI